MAINTERAVYSQPVLPTLHGIPERRCSNGGVSLGSNSLEVVKEILRLRPEISSGIGLMIYDGNNSISEPSCTTLKNNKLEFVGNEKLSLASILLTADMINRVPGVWAEKKDWKIAVTSKVISGLGWQHIPMMDFKCSTDLYNLESVIKTVENFATQGGYVLETQGGYHFYGRDLYDIATWENYIGTMARNNLVNPNYIEFCRKQGLTALRIDNQGINSPKVVKIFDPS